MRTSLRGRALIGGAAWILLALLIGGGVLGRLFDDFEGPAALAEPTGDPRFERPYSGLYWQVEHDGDPPIRSRSLWDAQLSLPADVPGATTVLLESDGPRDEPLRIIARAITLRNGETWRLAVATALTELQTEQRAFRQGLFFAQLALGGALIIAGLLQTALALRPLAGLRAAVLRYREGASPRIEGDFPSEVAPLAEDLNEMLDRNARIMERARRQAADLAHALKTPSAILRNELAQMRGADPASVRHAIEALDRIDAQTARHLARARMAAFAAPRGTLAPVAVAVGRIMRALHRMHAERGLQFEVDVDHTHRFQGEPQDLEELLGSLMENAAKWANSRVRVRSIENAEALTLIIEDDGVGIPPEKHAEALQAGVRLDQKKSGTGLGLSIATDLADIYGGTLTLSDSSLGGLCVTCRFPKR
jgi:signal transduction histidine kinase